MCSKVPLTSTAELAQCCRQNRERPQAAAALVAGKAAFPGLLRPDLDGGLLRPLNWRFGACTQEEVAEVPAFSTDENGDTKVEIVQQRVPVLDRATIAAIKQKALFFLPRPQREYMRMQRARRGSAARTAQPKALNVSSVGGAGGATASPPAGYAGPAELALMKARLEREDALQAAAKRSLLTGYGVPRKHSGGSGWSFPTDVPAEGYGGPYPMRRLEVEIGGRTLNQSECPSNYPARAPRDVCGHVSFVEMDATIAYKYAVAYAATGDERYARQAAGIVRAWSANNTAFGLRDKNGPLEAAWGGASLARTVDLLRSTWPGFQQTDLDTFLSWSNKNLMPQMDFFVDVLTRLPEAFSPGAGLPLMLGNWHASVADAMVSIGALGDDRARYDRGRTLYRFTVESYFKWGRGQWRRYGEDRDGRMIGEATETLRDIYHTLFGIGSLVQAAETAWHQNEDLYRESGYALAAALELHARIINAHAARDASRLPSGFRFFESMPPAPAGCAWRWDVKSQGWASFQTRGGAKCSELGDGYKYLLGVKYLPNGFEIGYNHFAGRLGMKMPETAELLGRYPVDWYEFCWGLATITHADTAKQLWRSGVRRSTLCKADGTPVTLTAPSIQVARDSSGHDRLTITPPSLSIITDDSQEQEQEILLSAPYIKITYPSLPNQILPIPMFGKR